MRDKETGKKILVLDDHTIPDADQLKEQQELATETLSDSIQEVADEYLGDFVGDIVAVTQYVVCAECGKGGGPLHKIGHGDDATYRHVGGCGAQIKPFNRETRRKLEMR